ncbi:MAG: UDP-N-acetylmuramate--L-alanine ligase, partial [Candidatus Omnitrophica bacterium]|nr:UDP-N-acetylmuramate--L-alanine ligase [Candidatus Omnitrophota bacterium]
SHSAKNVAGANIVVYSSCINEDNIEMQDARRRNMRVIRRIEALNMLLDNKNLVAVSGAHGKTTTTSLISYLLIKAGMDPTVFIGADVGFLNGNTQHGKGNIVVTEADESDGSFLLVNPLYSVVTNIDAEHMDYYKNMDNVLEAYSRFIENTKDEGCAFVCIEDDNVRAIVNKSSEKIVKYGLSKDADVRAINVELKGLDGASFDVVYKSEVLGKVNLSIIGMHNVLNSLVAVAMAMKLGASFSVIKNAIADFKGANRRFIVTHLDSDILIVDDYAHHPTEIEATLKTMEGSGKRIVAVFQPHRYSRTKYLRGEFGKCFDLADHLVITDIYSAHEAPIEGVSAEDLCESARECGHKGVNFVPKDEIVRHLVDVVKPGDAVFVLGAGDIDELPEKIVKAFSLHLTK